MTRVLLGLLALMDLLEQLVHRDDRGLLDLVARRVSRATKVQLVNQVLRANAAITVFQEQKVNPDLPAQLAHRVLQATPLILLHHLVLPVKQVIFDRVSEVTIKLRAQRRTRTAWLPRKCRT